MLPFKEIEKNSKKRPIKVKHKDLKRWDPEGSEYKSICPECNVGILLMKRNQETMELLDTDFCVSCGRRFIYTDFKELELR